MENSNNTDLVPKNLSSDFSLFKRKLEQLPENLRETYRETRKLLEGEMKLENLRSDDVERDKFYRLFADFIEDSNLVKMLYQNLLEEYFQLGIFFQDDYSELKTNASEKIEKLIRAGKWDGLENSANRANFRFEMLNLIRAKVHEKSVERGKNGERIAAVCFSGGGIRSATFGLGVLQGLAKHNLLSKFDYISTVSGGGYIGSWLSAWIHRIDENKTDFTNEKAQKVEKKLILQTADLPEPPEITHLRSYSNYMSPRPGLFSADTWTLVAVYLRNLLLNWTVFVPLIAAFLILPKMFVTFIGLNYSGFWQYVLLGLAIIGGVGGVLNINAMRPSFKKYSWVDQTYKTDNIGIIKSVEAKVLGWVLVWLIVLAFCISTFWAWNRGSFHTPFSQWIGSLLNTQNLTLIDLILFSELLFLGGYFLAWAFMLRKFIRVSRREKKKAKKQTDKSLWGKFKHLYRVYLAEPVASVVSGAVGGALLYLVVKNLLWMSSGLYEIFGNRVVDEVTPKFFVCFGAPLFLLVFLLAATLFIGLAVRFTDDEDREWMARLGAWVLMVIIGWSVISTAVIFGPRIFELPWKGSLFASVGGLSGLLTLILGFSNKTSAKEDDQPKNKKSFLMWFAPAVAAPIFVLFLVVLISSATNALTENVQIFKR
ncbi:MAG: patatin-like phospholipase family protein, partial [Actinomycetota bacterium]